jgi:hypothetical protein
VVYKRGGLDDNEPRHDDGLEYVRALRSILQYFRSNRSAASVPGGLLTLWCYGGQNSGVQLAGCNLKKEYTICRQSMQSKYDMRIAEILNTPSLSY